MGIWRKRYEEFGLARLEDEERPGRPVIYDHADVLLSVKLVTEMAPEGASRWTMAALAELWGATIPMVDWTCDEVGQLRGWNRFAR